MKNIDENLVFVILISLAIINATYFILSLFSGPLIGLIAAIFFTIHWWKRRDFKFILIIAIVWILIHIVELILIREIPYPILFYLNIVLPILLIFCSLIHFYLMKPKIN